MTHILFIQGQQQGRPKQGGPKPEFAELFQDLLASREPAPIYSAGLTPANRQTIRRIRSLNADVIVNGIANADTQGQALQVAQDFCERIGLPVINAPAVVGRNTRHETARALLGIEGLIVPLCLRLPTILRVNSPNPSRREHCACRSSCAAPEPISAQQRF